MDMQQFLNDFDNSKAKLPYSLIRFQKPLVLETFEPHLQSVGFCLHYVYAIPSQMLNRFDYQLKLKRSLFKNN
jgi:hypothetical protein